MSSQKKLFESEDFDKKRKLFTAEDFDKEQVSKTPHESSEEPIIPKPKSKNWLWWLIGTVIILCIIIWFFIKSGDKNVAIVGETDPLMEQTDSSAIEAEEQDVNSSVSSSDKSAASSEVETVDNAAPDSPSSGSMTKEAQEGLKQSSASPSSVVNISDDVESEAMKVIRGDYGVGQERKDKLGSKYQPIQNRVNQLKREGAF